MNTLGVFIFLKPSKRQAIGQQPDPFRKVMIYERDRDWKYIVHPYHRTGISNLSFWNQHITKSKLIYGLPAIYDQIQPSDKMVVKLEKFIKHSLNLYKKPIKENVRKERIRRQQIGKVIWEEARRLSGKYSKTLMAFDFLIF